MSSYSGRRLKSIVIHAAVLLSIASRAFAQDAPVPAPSCDPEKFTFGIGIGFSPIALAGDSLNRFGPVGLTDIYVPMQFGPYIRFEPSLGLFFQEGQQTLTDSVGNYQEHVSRQIVRVGFGIFYTSQPDVHFQWGLGARIGILSSEYETQYDRQSPADSNASENFAIFYYAGCFNAEYWLSKHFSIEGEVQLNFYSYGSPIRSYVGGPYPPNTSSQTVISTNEVLSARFYF